MRPVICFLRLRAGAAVCAEIAVLVCRWVVWPQLTAPIYSDVLDEKTSLIVLDRAEDVVMV